MDLDQEISNHLRWIEGVAAMLGGETLSDQAIGEIAQHHACELGHWLDSEDSGAFHGLDEFQALLESHQSFHALAGQLITLLQQDNEAEALQTGVRFIECSEDVISHLRALQAREAGGDGAAE